MKYTQKLAVGAAMLGAVAAAPAFAAFEYYLNFSNTLPDGPSYAQVTIDEISTGVFQFTVNPLDESDTPPGPFTSGTNYGVQLFSFNQVGTNTISNFALPTGWDDDTNQNVSAFGTFEYVVAGNGSNRQDPLVFTVNGPTGTAWWEQGSTGGVFFAAHIAGFDTISGQTSAFFAGSDEPFEPVPLPAAAWLFMSGLVPLAGFLRKRRAPLEV